LQSKEDEDKKNQENNENNLVRNSANHNTQNSVSGNGIRQSLRQSKKSKINQSNNNKSK
jgi:hypothetical protein